MLILGVLLISVSRPAVAETETLQSLSETAARQGARIGAGDRLASFKQHVEADALRTTYKLCAGYRRVRFFYSPDQTVSLGEAFEPWAKVYAHGILSAVDQIFGHAAEYNSLMQESSLSLDYWFQSLYVLYLIQSNGFLEAAINCLNTMDQREINYFASAILFADSVGAVQSQAAMFWATGRVLKLVFAPAAGLIAALRERVTKTSLVIAGTIVIPIAVDVFNQHMTAIEEARNVGEEILRPSPGHIESVRESERIVLMEHAYDLLKQVVSTRESGSQNPALEQEFEKFMKDNLSKDKIRRLRSRSRTLGEVRRTFL